MVLLTRIVFGFGRRLGDRELGLALLVALGAVFLRRRATVPSTNSQWSSRLPPDQQGEFIGYSTAPGCFVLIGTLAAGLLFERARRQR